MVPMDDPNEAVSEALVEALATAEGVDPALLRPPLAEYFDPDTLDALAASATVRWRFETTVYGHEIGVDGDGTVVVDGEVYRTGSW